MPHKPKALNKKSSKKKNHLAYASAASQSEHITTISLIPRPRGQAGRRKGGFSLQEAMGMLGKPNRFKKMKRHVRSYALSVKLDLTKPYTKQDPAKLLALTAHVVELCPFLKRFEYHWPVADVLKGYLQNCNKRFKQRAAAEQAEETDAEPDAAAMDDESSDSDSGSSEDSGSDNVDKKGKSAAKPGPKKVLAVTSRPSTRIQPIVIPGQARADIQGRANSARDTSNVAGPSARPEISHASWEDDVYSSSDESEGPPAAANKKRRIYKRNNSLVIAEAVASPSPLPGSPSNLQAIIPSRNDRDDMADLFQDLEEQIADDANRTTLHLKICPQPGCAHPIPAKPDPLLRKLLDQREEALKNNLIESPAQLANLNLEICMRISYKTLLMSQGKREGWPMTIDAQKLSDRVMGLLQDLNQVILRPKQNSVFWGVLQATFQPQLSLDRIAALYDQNPSHPRLERVYSAARVGYYGEEGEAIIVSALEVMYPDWHLAAFRLPPFNSRSFLRLVLVPEAAIRLIAQDQQVTNIEAYKIMSNSAAYGYFRFPYAEPDLDDPDVDVHLRTPSEIVVYKNFKKLQARRESTTALMKPGEEVTTSEAKGPETHAAQEKSTGRPKRTLVRTYHTRRASQNNPRAEEKTKVENTRILTDADFPKPLPAKKGPKKGKKGKNAAHK
ncbi:hypothetical protein BN946_scf184579.g23 [Trametes cinnabarina]|uniref:Restriction of telomere capping protein 4 n=1 Tax=Pycnoporus cinnabarinus TaxID=5643 RepID=A0A060S7T5_PYCCI|nr:hypothetical protein BN946_scf184579.g23 [Trametes cinnabarina]